MTGSAPFTLLVTADGGTFVGRDTTTGRSWVHVPGAEGSPPSPTDPVSLVADLRAAASHIDDAGSGDSHGDVTTRSRLVQRVSLSDASRGTRTHANAEAGELLELAPVGALERYRLPAAPTGRTCLPLPAGEQLDGVAPGRFGEPLGRRPRHSGADDVVELDGDSRAQAILSGDG